MNFCLNSHQFPSLWSKRHQNNSYSDFLMSLHAQVFSPILSPHTQNKRYLTLKCLEKERETCREHGLGMLSKYKMGWCSRLCSYPIYINVAQTILVHTHNLLLQTCNCSHEDFLLTAFGEGQKSWVVNASGNSPVNRDEVGGQIPQLPCSLLGAGVSASGGSHPETGGYGGHLKGK